VSILCLIRSLIDTGRENIESTLQSLSDLAGAQIAFSGCYPGWKPDTSSAVMAIVKDTYQSIYHKEPVIMVIHAGLECGLFKSIILNWIWSPSARPSVIRTALTKW
jgi:dipeptidase D